MEKKIKSIAVVRMGRNFPLCNNKNTPVATADAANVKHQISREIQDKRCPVATPAIIASATGTNGIRRKAR
jgi:hypothetical protein